MMCQVHKFSVANYSIKRYIARSMPGLFKIISTRKKRGRNQKDSDKGFPTGI